MSITRKAVRVQGGRFFSESLAELNFSVSAEANTAAVTQRREAGLSGVSDEAECLLPSRGQPCSKHQYNTRKVCGKLTQRIFKVYFLIQTYVSSEEQLDSSSEVKTMHLN